MVNVERSKSPKAIKIKLFLPDFAQHYPITLNKIQIEGPVPLCAKLWSDSKNCEYRYEDSSIME